MSTAHDPAAMAAEARAAAHAVATCSTATKNAVLFDLADRLVAERPRIIEANTADLSAAERDGITGPKLKRLRLGPDALDQLTAGLRHIASLPDPIGTVTRDDTTPAGLHVRKVRSPIGVIMMIYEARPNVTLDAFSLCFKAGNACILKGGREAAQSNAILAELAHTVLDAHGVPRAALSLVSTSERAVMQALLQLDTLIDLVIPRGGAPLIRFVHEHARMPTVQHFHGVCHIYVDAAADLQSAVDICVTAKASAPATCNAAEAVLIHAAVADAFLPPFMARCAAAGIEVRGDDAVRDRAPDATPATADDWGTEYLDLIMAARVVPDLDAAIEHIHRYGSNHTEAIITADRHAAEQFCQRVQASCTVVNASTRFNDGFQLGLGAEIGISTSKIHAYGPMGLEELTTQRYVVFGDGQTR